MNEDGGTTGNEDLAQLQAELTAAQGDMARLRAESDDAEARAQAALAESARLQTELGAANDAAAAFDADAASLRSMLEESEERNRDGASRYRELAARAEPALPSDLIAGDTIEAIDASIAKARELAESVRSHIEAQAQAARVPAGAPQRSAPDFSAMTPEQKIRHGLAQRSAGG
jgi:chromosome segregation ATPase